MVSKEQVVEDLKNLLTTINYDYTSDDFLIGFTVDSVIREAKNIIHKSDIPDALLQVCIFRSFGNFLSFKKGAGNLDLTSLNITPLEESIKEGEVTINYAKGMSKEQQLDFLLKHTSNYAYEYILSFRRILW